MLSLLEQRRTGIWRQVEQIRNKEERGPTSGKRGDCWAGLRVCPVKAGKRELLLFAGAPGKLCASCPARALIPIREMRHFHSQKSGSAKGAHHK